MPGLENGPRPETDGRKTGAVAGAAERRYQSRRSGLWVGQIQTPEGERMSCLLLNVSTGGARLVPQRPLAEGSIVTLLAPVSGTRRARVAWATKSHVGLQFLGDTIDSKFRPF